jgi:cytochrome P450
VNSDVQREEASGSKFKIPAHVPPELVVDLDIYALPDGDIDPQVAWRKFAAFDKGPLVYSPYNGGHWVATVPADVARFQRDTKNLSSTVNTVPDRGGPRLVPLESDPPQHTQYRSNVLPLFTGKALKDLEPRIQALAEELVEGLQPRGECNFIADFALQFPVAIVLQLLGLPVEDGDMLNRYADMLARDPDPNVKAQAYAAVTAYLDGWIQKRIDEPADDAITQLTKATIDGRPYTREEILSTVTLLTFGGVDSVAMHLSFIVLYLARHPAQRNYVKANLDNLDGIVSEFARRFPIANMMRKVAHDMEHEGVILKAGDMLAIPAPMYNFAEEIFPDAASVDFSRPQNQLHLTFGTGAHTCPGASLARLEVKIFLREWLKRIPDFHVKPDVPVRLRASVTSAVDQLWLQWSVA